MMDGLEEHIEAAWVIRCGRCKTEAVDYGDHLANAMDYFWTLGWRIVRWSKTRNRCFCPDCVDDMKPILRAPDPRESKG